MEALLSPLETRVIRDTSHAEPHLVAVEAEQKSTTTQDSVIESLEDAIEALKSKPDLDLLTRVLLWLESSTSDTQRFNIKIPSPKAAQITFVLVTDIVPNYWKSLTGKGTSKQSKQKRLLLRNLRNMSGIGAIIARLRFFLDLKADPQRDGQSITSSKSQDLNELLSVLESLLIGNKFVLSIWIDIHTLFSDVLQRAMLWKEFTTTLAGGRLLSLAAEAFHVTNKTSPEASRGNWLGDGSQYSSWLGENVLCMIMNFRESTVEDWKSVALLVNRAMKLGYTDQFVEATCSSLICGEDQLLTNTVSLIQHLGVYEQKNFLYSLLRVLSRRHLGVNSGGGIHDEKQRGCSKSSRGVAALISKLANNSAVLKDGLVDWLIGVSGDGIGQEISIRRAVISALANDHTRILNVFNKSLESFADKLSISHTPILHQEVYAQVLLMAAGIIHRSDAQELSIMARSSLYLSAISNRLAASSARASLLGMIVGTAISELVDPKEKQINFSTEEINSPEGQWYRSLTQLTDTVGSIGDLKPSASTSSEPLSSSRDEVISGKSAKHSATTSSTSKIISIEELDNSESEDEDLVPYEKPDSDPSDSDEDATLVQRHRPVAPVYIRDLIAGLRDTENFDRHKLAIYTAPSLIRRKANFGTEVTEHIEDLASLLVGLSDKYEMDKFQEKRLQGMIAILIAQPLRMGQWFARTYFGGDYSISQRASILSTLGLGARELAGFQKEDAAVTGGATAPETSFPSKKLPQKLHKIFSTEDSSSSFSPLNSISQSLENTMLQPMALSAADKFAGPNALKVRTFSSRMAVEKKRQKPIPNALAKVVAEGFFLPLTGRWRIHLQAYGTRTPHTSAPLLPLFLKTLSLLLHASGPSTLALPQLTTDFWSLLLSLRSSASKDPTTLEALLYGLVTILDVNADSVTQQRRLAEENAKELLETRAWAEDVWERVGEGRARVLCAAVLSRVADVVGAWELLMAGEMSGWL